MWIQIKEMLASQNVFFFSLALDSVECLALSDFCSLCGSFYGFPWINQQSARNSSFSALCEFRPFAFIYSLSFLLSSPWNWLCWTDQTIVPLEWKFLILLFFAFLWECCENNKQAKSQNIKKSTSNIAPLSSFYFTFTYFHRRTHQPMMITRTRIRRLTTKKAHASHKSGVTMA